MKIKIDFSAYGKSNIRNGARIGMTMLEIILAMAIGSILLVALTRVGSILSSLGNLAGDSLQAEQNVRQATDDFAADVRGMGQSSLGAYPIESAATSSFVFYSDLDRDGLFEKVRYFLSGNTLSKGVIKPSGNPLSYPTSSEIITVSVSNAVADGNIFDYFGSSYTGSATDTPLVSPVDPTAVRVVKFKISSDVNTKSAPRRIGLESVVTMRNLRSN